ncbi:MAG: ABC transporter permease [Clostridioides sp.]|jgi:putative ABC transport system permease protein|nr:ABC transporter permease [Clostridioides sp.]
MLSILTQSFILAIMAIGVYITYKILDFPDMTADGSYTLGACIVASCLVNSVPMYISILLSIIGGAIAGLLTGLLHVKLKISNLLSGILVMGMLYSINIRIMGKSNIPLFDCKHLFNLNISPVIVALLFVLLCKIFLELFLKTGLGYALKGVGDNEQMIKSLGVNTGNIKILGLMLSNAIISLAGGLTAQFQGFSDVNMGTGTLMLGIASIIIGLTLFKKIVWISDITAIIVGTIIYEFSIYFAIQGGMLPSDLKLITSAIIIIFLAVTKFNYKKAGKFAINRGKSFSKLAKANK